MAWNGTTGSRGFPTSTRAKILERDPICRCPGCPMCSTGCTRASTEADHVIAVTDGGHHDISNGRGMCKPCHNRKTQAAIHAKRPRQARTTEQHPGLI